MSSERDRPFGRRSTMMRCSRVPSTVLVCQLTAAFVLSLCAPIGAAVVCVGSDGHTGFERLFDSCCVAGAAHGEDAAGSRQWTDRCCGDCVDLELTSPSMKNEQDRFFCRDRVVAEAVPSRSNPPEIGPSFVVVPDFDDVHWRSLVLLSTVILLT